MSIIVNLYYTGQNGNARKFAEEMTSRGIVDAETDCGTSGKIQASPSGGMIC